jgi:predicted flavoprotein YhiN
VSAQDLEKRLARPRGKQSLSTFLRKAAQLPPVAIALLQEAAKARPAPLNTMSAGDLAAAIKAVPVRLTGVAPIEKAISTAGGVTWGAVNADLMLRDRPGTFIAGEMLDWEAPTGGYLLQAVFATGARAGHGVLRWLKAQTAHVNGS